MAYTKARPSGWQDTTLPKNFRDALDTIEQGISDALPKDGSQAMYGDLNMGGHKISDVANPTAQSDAATKKYVDGEDAKKVNLDGRSVMQGDLQMGDNKVTGLGNVTGEDPDSTAATVGYVKSVAQDAEDALSEHASEADNTYLRRDGGKPMTGDLDMGGKLISELSDPVNESDAATKKYVDAAKSAAEENASNTYLSKSGGTMSGDLNMENNRVEGLHDIDAASNDSSAANKKYVDAEAQRLQAQMNELSDGLTGVLGRLDSASKVGTEIYVTHPAGAYRAGDRISSESDLSTVLYDMLCRPVDPVIEKHPSATIHVEDLTLKTAQIETGTVVTAAWEVSLDPGKYSYKSEAIEIIDGESQYVASDHTGVEIDGLRVLAEDVILSEYMYTVEDETAMLELVDSSAVEAEPETVDELADTGESAVVSTTHRVISDGQRVYRKDTRSVWEYSSGEDNDPSNINNWREATDTSTSGEYILSEPLSDDGIIFRVEIAHTQGNKALTNIETVANPEQPIQIAAGNVAAEFNLKGYRKMFYGAVSESVVSGNVVRESITSSVIRGLTGIKPDKSAHTFTAPAGSTKVIIAFPKAYTTNKPKVEMMTLSWEDYSSFFYEVSGGVKVADARGGDNGLADYTVYTYEFNAISADTQFRVTMR